MTATSIARIVVPSLALVGACAAALVFGVTHIRRAPPVETSAATAAPEQAEANAAAAELAVSLRTPATDDSAPVFDIARIERTGDAVIAGRAAPGAIVELLRNGERLEGVVADQSGQFVMVPPRLPPGDYELTLRSRLPVGTLATSKQGVVVALDEVESNPGAVQSRPEVPFNVPETAMTKGLWQDHAGRSSQARLLSQPPLHIAKRHDVAVSQLLHATAATPLSDGGSSSAVLEPKIATTVVFGGESLWRISRVTYGTGARYALVYKANRNRIHDPNRIYPGQIFFLPMKAR